MPTKKKSGTKRNTPTFVAAFRAFIAKQRWPRGKKPVKRAEVEKATVEQIMQKLLDTTPTDPPSKVDSDGNRILLRPKKVTSGSGNIRFP